MILEHMQAPLHRYTFSVRPIRVWVEAQCEGRVLNLFAGKTKLRVDEFRVDSDTSLPADEHAEALHFAAAARLRGAAFDTILLDPPYSYRKSMELYGGRRCSRFSRLKDLLPGILSPNGKVITFGYHSVSMGQRRGFRVEKILLLSHGGAIHDTIATVERRGGPPEKPQEN